MLFLHFHLYQQINKIIPVSICITNEKEEFNNLSEFKERILSENIDKINIFRNQYGEKEFNVSIKNFYKIIKKRNLLKKYIPFYKYFVNKK